jgi:enamine deaminase RidA (YjgF/YER057c/UK114 family)
MIPVPWTGISARRVFVADAVDWPSISDVFGETFRDIRPALTATVCGMIVPRIKLEIEALARKPSNNT